MISYVDKIFRKLGLELRKGIEVLTEYLEKGLKESKDFLLFVSLPTGYGKSSFTFTLSTLVYQGELRDDLLNVIHVLPMKSIVEDLLDKAKSWRENLGLRDLKIGAQCSLPLGSYKDPMFLRDLVYTTLDSYFLNFMKLTVNVRSSTAYFETPRAVIYSSFSIFDEAHLFIEVDEQNAFTILVNSIDRLLNAKLPVLVMTATLPTSMIFHTLNYLTHAKNYLVLTLDSYEERKDNIIRVFDKDWNERFNNVLYKTYFIKSNEITRLITNLEQSRKVLIIRNTVKRAFETYKLITEKADPSKIVVLHGRLRVCDRIKALERIEKVRLVIATQVIEAGVDLDYDVLITDIAPLAQLIQRVGRIIRDPVKRKESELVGEVYITEDVPPQPYPPELVERTRQVLKDVLKSPGDILWRIPDSKNPKSYLNLLNQVYTNEISSKLSLNNELIFKLNLIDSYATLTRHDLIRYNVIDYLCQVLRETFLIPVIVLKKVYEIKTSNDIKKLSEGLADAIRKELEILLSFSPKTLYEATYYVTVSLDSNYVLRNRQIITFRDNSVEKVYFVYKLRHEEIIQIFEEDAKTFFDNLSKGTFMSYLSKVENRIRKELRIEEPFSIIGILGNSEHYYVIDDTPLGYI